MCQQIVMALLYKLPYIPKRVSKNSKILVFLYAIVGSIRRCLRQLVNSAKLRHPHFKILRTYVYI